MSLERRLRDGLPGIASQVDVDVEDHLYETEGRAGRRVRTRQRLARVAAAVAVALVGVGVVGAMQLRGGGDDDQRVATDPGPIDPRDSRPELLAGRYESTVPDVGGGEEDGLVSGTWVAVLSPDGTIELDAPPAYTGTRSGLFRVTKDAFDTDVFMSDLCSGQLPGRYRSELSATSLSLTLVEDPCAPRVRLLTGQSWSVVTGE